jgi:hypothetical protein
VRSRVHLILVPGRGEWEDSTCTLASACAFGGPLAGKAIPRKVDL